MQKLDICPLFDAPAADTFHKAHICLLGDAAHASTRHQGSGAAIAIEDVFVLGTLVGDAKDAPSLEAVFTAYDIDLKPRTQKLVATSREASHLFAMALLGVGTNREAIKKKIEGRMSWMWNEDLTAEVHEAR